MANLLTGDYEAVLQVSEATVNRLMASMHQNAGRNPNTPSFPHSVGLRLGDPFVIDGVRGAAWAQVSVPRIELIDGATDRFALQVHLRMRYRPDAGTKPLAPYIEGTLRAEYALEDVDPRCPGWRNLASRYVWVRVVEDSVSFVGTAAGERDGGAVVLDQNAIRAEVTTQLAALLTYSFDPAPQDVSALPFRRGSVKSIRQSPATISLLLGAEHLDVGGVAVAIPISVTHDTPGGSLNSVQNVVLSDRDFAVAVSVDTIRSMIEPALQTIRAYTRTDGVTVGPVSTVYRTSITQASAQWVPAGSYATIAVSAQGRSHTDSVLPDLNFTIQQDLQVDFDQGAESLRIWVRSTTVTGHAKVPPDLLRAISKLVVDGVHAMGTAACADAQQALRSRMDPKPLRDALAKLDEHVDAYFDQAEFLSPGFVIRGWISVSPRRAPVATFEKLDADTFSALQSWLPGGRIDEFRWSWAWFNNAGPAGTLRLEDRYLLSRPRRSVSKFGAVMSDARLPGLDGAGAICLSVKGVVVDATTGELVPIETRSFCTRFGFEMSRFGGARLFLREWGDAGALEHVFGAAHAGVVDVSADSQQVPSCNTLVLHAGRTMNDEFAATLRGGLSECRRNDAGLLVLVLFEEGVLSGPNDDLISPLRDLAARLDAPLVINEDVKGGWRRVLFVSSEAPAWRLLSPDGSILWMHEGSLGSAELAHALDDLLYPSSGAQPSAVQVDLGSRFVSPEMFEPLFRNRLPERPHCPPWRVHGIRPSDVASAIVFVQTGERASAERLQVLQTEVGAHGASDGGVLVVVDGADDAEARELAAALGERFTVVADPDGEGARELGVRCWPTIVAIEEPTLLGVQEVTA
jgi:hypothetical protein